MVHDPRVGTTLARLGGLYRDPARVDRDASSLLKSGVGNTLAPIAAQLVEDNGTSTNVLVLQGTIAIHFRGQTYQLLVDMYLPGGYPVRPPICYVRLAENMYLKENHRHVGVDGKVYLPYLHEWNPNTHNLVHLVVEMSSVFSAVPPVFSRPASSSSTSGSSAANNQNNRPAVRQQAVSTSMASSSTTTASQYSAMSDQERMEAALAASAAEEAARQAEAARKKAAEQEERDRLAAQKAWEDQRTNQVRETVRQKMVQYLQESAQLTKQQVAADQQDAVRLTVAKEQKIDHQVGFFQKLQTDLERQCEVADERKEEIEAWLEQAKNDKSGDGSNNKEKPSIDDQVQAASSLQAQMLDLAAENAAMSDALYFLDRALYQGNLTLETHLRQVRKLAKRQFLVKAHLIKIQQALVARG